MRVPVPALTVKHVFVGWRRWTVYWNPLAPSPRVIAEQNLRSVWGDGCRDNGASFPARTMGSALTRFGARRIARAVGRQQYGFDGPYFSIWTEKNDA